MATRLGGKLVKITGPIAEWEKKVGSMDLVHLSGGLLIHCEASDDMWTHTQESTEWGVEHGHNVDKYGVISKEDMKKEIAMLIEELEKVKAKKEEMEKALKLEIKELKHENDVLRRQRNKCLVMPEAPQAGMIYYIPCVHFNTEASL
ncbi:hypothetical protein DAPPUDRAFT_246695 [Daphnia pulex]|uniref:Uncharacterized protein n=1 Tax=Daphnia pulex TaxID=6669 RepID=E9GR25_DAPPU|nr:hypothetical protein DAPPUDRAFT_246695 [Daphnia pulex]|eukprot:EFX78067.1 hypothetical protein DAPPUDRAFT_246695 [Daphnia pulex]